MDKWLVTGATGLLGANAVLRLSRNARVVGSARARPVAMSPESFVAVDLAHAGSRADLVERVSPNVVFHSAALSSIEACDADPALARALNVEASADLARQAAAVGARFVLVSTDAVFDGHSGSYTEDDATSPTTEYGRTKVDAERAVMDANPEAIVARVNFYGWSPSGTRSLAEFFYRHLSEGKPVNGFTDITVSTLYVEDLIDAITALVSTDASGTFHVASSEAISKYEFGRLLANALGYSADLVSPALSTDFLKHARGANLSLSTAKYEAVIGQPLNDQATSIAGLRRALREGVPSDIAKFAHFG